MLELTKQYDEVSWVENWFYHPEKYGLTTVGSIDFGASYEFDTYVVVKDAAGNFYWAHDSGCSCQTPFEDVWDLKDLNDWADWIDFRDEILSRTESETKPRAIEFLMKLEKVTPGAVFERLRKLGKDVIPGG